MRRCFESYRQWEETRRRSAKTSTPYTWIDRTDAKYVADVLTTLPNAGNVSAVLKPDLPGTYMVLVTVLDSCNVTTQVSSSLFPYGQCE